jgi:hypothetical protein
VYVAIANDVGHSTMTTLVACEIAPELGPEEESSHFITIGKPNMTSVNDDDSSVDAVGGFLAAAAQTPGAAAT